MRSNLPTVVAILVLMLLSAPLTMVAGGPAQSGSTDPVPVYMNFNNGNGASAELTPLSVAADPVENVVMYGYLPPLPSPVGRWGTNDLKMPVSIYGAFSCTLWAESTDGAKNAYFEVSIYKNSDLVQEYNTSKQDLNKSPARFDIFHTLNVDLMVGDNLVVWLDFRADLVINPFPQPAQASLLFGGGSYNSGISVTTLPITVEILEPEVQSGADYIGFKTKVKEAFDVDPSKMIFNLTITPPEGGEIKSLSDVEGKKTDEGIIFTTDWDYKKDKSKDGEYTITMDVSYDGNLTFSNTTSYKIDVPTKSVSDIGDTKINPMVVGLVVTGLAIVVIAIYLNKKKRLRKGKGRSKPKKGKSVSRRSSKKPPKTKPKDEDDD